MQLVTVIFPTFFVCLFLAIFLPIFGFIGYRVYRSSKLAQESSDWPVVTGTMTQCQLVPRPRTGYQVMVLYEYEVAGQQYRHNVLAYGVQPFKSLMEQQTFVAEHPAGTPITVHYQPSAPQTAALFTGPYPTWLLTLFVVMFMLMLPMLFFPVIIMLVTIIGVWVGSSTIN